MIDSIKQWLDRLLDEKNYTLEALLFIATFLIIPHEVFTPLLLITFAYAFVKLRKSERKRDRPNLEDDTR